MEENKKIKVIICSGTACYVMGASDIFLIEENLPENLKGKVEVDGSTCLEYCKTGGHGKPPFVTVNEELISDATMASVIEKIQEYADAEYK